MAATEDIATTASVPKKWNPITALNQSLANVELDDSSAGQN